MLLRNLVSRFGQPQVVAEPAARVEVALPAPPPRERPRSRSIEDSLGDSASILRRLNGVLSDAEESRVSEGDAAHLSSLLDFCARQHYLAGQLSDPLFRRVTGGHRVMWRIGRAVEQLVRESLIAAYEGEVYGKWVCRCRLTSYEGTKRLDGAVAVCPRCASAVDRYQELVLRDEGAEVVGSPDVVLRRNHEDWAVEIKSMVGHEFDGLGSPKGDHVLQAAGYRRLLRVSGNQVADKVIVIYCTKDFKYGSPLKVYTVDVSVRQYEDAVSQMWAGARQLTTAKRTGRLPERLLRCSSSTSGPARSCPVAGRCFAFDG